MDVVNGENESVARHYNIADLFEMTAAEVPERTAVVGGDTRLTYRELDERSNRFAHHLIGCGLGKDSRVAIYSWNRTEWVEAMMGAFKARMTPINVNYRYVADELRYILDNSGSEALVFERSFAPIVEKVRSDLPGLTNYIVLEDGSDEPFEGGISFEDALAGSSPDPLRIERDEGDVYILYTGGTTGFPKGVVWRHEDLFFAALGGGGYGQPDIVTPTEIVERIAAPDAIVKSLTLAPVMHGAAQWGMMITLFAGGQVTMATTRGFDPNEAWRLVEAEQINSILVVGDAMARPLAEALDAEPDRYDVSSVFVIGSGGAVFSSAVKDQLRAHLPDLLTVDTFGASELGAAGTQADPTVGTNFPHEPHMSVLGDDLKPTPPGVIGRLARRGYMPLGYLGDEAKTAATFVTDDEGVRWAIPGDFCRFEEDGTITLLGRGSGCINSGGEKIFPEEVEAVLKGHPDVFDVLVVGVPDPRFTERVAAIVQPREGHDVDLASLDAHVREHLAGYKAPRELRIVEAIGRTASGKADYRWAKAQFGDA